MHIFWFSLQEKPVLVDFWKWYVNYRYWVINIDLHDKEVNVTELIYQEDYEYAMNSFSELIEKGVFTNYVARIITKKKKLNG